MNEYDDNQNCQVFEQNSSYEWAIQECCGSCLWNPDVYTIQEPIIFELLRILSLQDAGCPVERHELTNEEWLALGEIKRERDKVEDKKDG